MPACSPCDRPMPQGWAGDEEGGEGVHHARASAQLDPALIEHFGLLYIMDCLLCLFVPGLSSAQGSCNPLCFVGEDHEGPRGQEHA